MPAALAPTSAADEVRLPRTALVRRLVFMALAGAGLAGVAIASIAVGSRTIPAGDVWRLLWHPDGSDASTIVHDLRLPRTELGLLVGAALGVAGALMQAVTRNPLAEPGLLGVNAGAAAAVVSATAFLGVSSALGTVWFGFLGAGLASVVVYGVGSTGRSGATPIRLALAGTAVTFVLYAYVQGLVLLRPQALDQYRFWQVGSLAGRADGVQLQVGGFVVAGLVVAALLGRPLNALGLGDDAGRSLGLSPTRVRGASAGAIAVLCGAATAAVGPIAFVGLAVPHVVRAALGPDQRWVIPGSALLGPVLLLGADVVGRVLTRPGELPVGVVCAVLGAPVFILIVRRRRIPQL